MSAGPTREDVPSAVSDILSRFITKYEWTDGPLATLRDEVFGKYGQLGHIDDSDRLNSMLSKYEDVNMRDQRLYLNFEPTEDKRILPLVTIQSSQHWLHLSIYTLLTMLDNNGILRSLAVRFETNEGDPDDNVGKHDFLHAQLCTCIYDSDGRIIAKAKTPEWLPTSQPSFPLDADDQIGLVLCMLTSLYGGAHVLSKFSATGDKRLREYLGRVRALSAR